MPLVKFVAALMGAALLLTGCSVAVSSPPSTTVAMASASVALSADEFSTLIDKPGVVVVDVRTPAEFALGHIDGAINIDIESADFDAKIAQLERSVTYALYCRSGNRSSVALMEMRAEGFSDVQHLAGGITAWQAAGKTLVR